VEYQFRDLKALIDNFAAPHATSNGIQHERAKAELIAKLSSEICTSLGALNSAMKSSAKSNDQLGKKVFWLNIILTFATSIGAFATVVIACK